MKRWLIVVSIVILAIVSRASSRALLPRLRAARHAAPIRQHGTLNRVAREFHDAKTEIAEATGAKCQLDDCAKFDELKKALLALIEYLECPEVPPVPPTTSSSSYSDNDLDLGILDK